MTKRPVFLIVVCFAALSIGSAQQPADKHAGDCETKNWNWKPNDPKGPEAWSQTYPLCAQGQQAPINLTSKGAPQAPFQVHYQPFTGKVLNNGYKVMVNVPSTGAGGYIEIDSERFNLVEFHFHVKSEHTVDGHQFAVEAHLVHQSVKDPNKFAAIGILYESSAAGGNPLVERVIGAAHPSCGSLSSDMHIDPRQLFPGGTAKGTYYYYSGSLTNPDCIPIAHFLVAADTRSTVNAATIGKLRQIVAGFPNNAAVNYGFNFRPVQPLLPGLGVNHREAEVQSGGKAGKRP